MGLGTEQGEGGGDGGLPAPPVSPVALRCQALASTMLGASLSVPSSCHTLMEA